MPDFVADGQPFETPIGAASDGYAQTSPPAGSEIAAQFHNLSLSEGLLRAAQRGQYAGSSWFDRALVVSGAAETGQVVEPPIETPMLSADEANKRYAPEGTTITDHPLPEGVAQSIGEARRQEIERESVMSRFAGAHSVPTTFATGLVGFIADPLNASTMFLPGIGEEAVLAGAGRVGLATSGIAARTLARVGAGAASGALAQAPLSLARYGLGQEEASDYGLRDVFTDLMYGAAGGAITHAALGTIGDVLRARRGAAGRPPEGAAIPAEAPSPEAESVLTADATSKADAMRAAVAQIVDGRPVDIDDFFPPPPATATAVGRFMDHPMLPEALPDAASLGLDETAIARRVDPDTFAELDRLSQRRDNLRRWLDELEAPRSSMAEGAAPHGAAVAALDSQLADLRVQIESANQRMAKVYGSRVADLLEQRDQLAGERGQAITEITARDTPDMARVRQALADTDYRMRDLAPRVAAAREQARGQMADTVSARAAEQQRSGAAAQAAFMRPVMVPPGTLPAIEPRTPTIDLAAIAERQRDLRGNGFAPGIPQAEFRALNEELYQPKPPAAAEPGERSPARSMPQRRPADASARAPDTPAASAARAAPEPAAAPAPGEPIRSEIPASVQSFRPGDLTVDARRFQFKEGGDEAGVSGRLRGVTSWDPIKAGMGIVYEDADGARYIVDGHQRLALARRSAEADPGQNPQLHGWVLRAADGVSADEARIIAAAKNIAEGTGTAVDAAKVLRDRPDLVAQLPPRSELVRQARGLVNLDDHAFRLVINDVVPPNYAAIVGRLVPDNARMQGALLELLAKTDPENAVQAEAIVRQGILAGTRAETQGSLFGDQEVVSSLYLDRAKILDRAMKLLRRDRRVFATLVQEQETLEAAGNRLAADVNQRRATADAQAAEILQLLASRHGPVSDALSAAARRSRDTGNIAEAVREFAGALRREAESGNLARLGDGLARSGDDVGAENTAGAGGRDSAGLRPGDTAAITERIGVVIDAARRPELQDLAAETGIPTRGHTDDEFYEAVVEHLGPAQSEQRAATFAAAADQDFEAAERARTEWTAQGDQFVLPGAERSAQQAAIAREVEARGKIAPRAPQEAPGGMFAPREAGQPGLFDHELAEAERQLDASGGTLLPEEQAELTRTAVGLEHADNIEQAAQAAAECLGRGGA
jgi:hypothetical protein